MDREGSPNELPSRGDGERKKPINVHREAGCGAPSGCFPSQRLPANLRAFHFWCPALLHRIFEQSVQLLTNYSAFYWLAFVFSLLIACEVPQSLNTTTPAGRDFVS